MKLIAFKYNAMPINLHCTCFSVKWMYTRVPGVNVLSRLSEMYLIRVSQRYCLYFLGYRRDITSKCVLLTSSVSIMLQHWPTDVMRWCGLTITVSAGDGTAQDSQYPLHALVVIRNSTQFGMLIFLVWPVDIRKNASITLKKKTVIFINKASYTL